MISAPLPRASVDELQHLRHRSAQRLRRSGVQVCLVKSITSSAVSVGLDLGRLQRRRRRKLGRAPFLDQCLRLRGRRGDASRGPRSSAPEQQTCECLCIVEPPGGSWLAG